MDFLLTKKEAERREIKFQGKTAGEAWKHAQNLDGLIRTRLVILCCAMLVLGMIVYQLATRRMNYSQPCFYVSHNSHGQKTRLFL